MKRKIFAGLSAFALVAGFWACGDGSVEALNDDDLTVKGFLEDSDVDTTAKSGFFKPEDVETAKADCLLNEKCKAAMDKAAGDSVVPTSEAAIPTAYSSSSPANPGSSSAKGPIVNYSSASVTPVAGSSSSATSSGQTTVSSSSETAIADWTNPDASCKVKTSSAIQKGGTGEWTIDMVGACPDYLTDKAGNKACKNAFESADCEMTLTGSNEKTTTVKCNQSPVTATYAGIGSYGAKIKVGDHVHDCSGKVEVQGTPVTGCKCSVDENAPDVTGGEAKVTWTVSGCMAGSTAADIGTWTWTGATGTTNTATATFTTKDETKTPTVKVTSTENASMNVTCPSAKAIDNTQPDNYACSVSPNAVNLGESFTFSISGYSGPVWNPSITGEDGFKLENQNPPLKVSPLKAGVIKYEYKMSGQVNNNNFTESCTKYVTVTDNSSSWTSKSITLSYGGAADTLESGYIYTISYTRTDGGPTGSLVCSGSGGLACGTNEAKTLTSGEASMGSGSSCTSVKVFGTASCKHTW